jgi:hypothetical protein
LSFHEHFEWSQTSGVIRGEATPIYMYWPNAMERICRYNAAAKLILCLRHPAYRAHSHWRMEIMRSAETLSFENAISRAGRRRVRNAEGGVHRVYSYVERASTPLRFVDCCSYSENTLSRVYRFLNVAPAALAETAYIVPLCSDEIGAISETAFAEIEEHFRDGY